MPAIDLHPFWTELFRPSRVRPASDEPALQAAWLLEAERLPHESERLLRRHPALPAPLRALLAGAAALQFDDPEAACRHLAAALRHYDDALHPLHLWASVLLGHAQLEAGRPDAAPLRLALRGAARDALPLLQLDALRGLVRLHDERGEAAARDQALQTGLALAAAHPAHPAADSLRRAAAQCRAREGLDEGERDPACGDGPAQQMQAALRRLLQGDEAGAQQTQRQLDALRAQQFWPLKWQVEFGWLQGLLAARQGQPLQQPVLADAPARAQTLCGLHAQVLDAGHALLRRRPWPAPRRQALAAQLQQAGLARAAARLALVAALDAAEPLAALQAWEADAAADPLDALWLAPRLAPWWPQLLAAPAASRSATRQAWLRRLGAAMQARHGSEAPPQGLTPKELAVLRLIGQRWSNAQIAAQLGVGESTVKTHINRLYAKLQLPHREAAVQHALTLG